MKNHKLVNDVLLQINKKWSHLKQSQKNWIMEVAEKAHKNYVLKYKRLPMRKRKYEIFEEIADKVRQRGIWIPYGELKTHVNKKLDRLNRKNSLFN